MRHIRKDPSPQALERWVADQLATPGGVVNLTYRGLPFKRELLDTLIGEQHQRCAYTCRWIARETAKVEHLKPQSVCRAEVQAAGQTFGRVRGDDLAYDNLVAARDVPGPAPYGEAARGPWYDPALFVSPLVAGNDRRFRYNLHDGSVEPASPTDAGAREMIDRLKLNHPTLRVDRKRQLDGMFPAGIVGTLTAADLRAIAHGHEPPSRAPGVEFASVLRSVALDLLP